MALRTAPYLRNFYAPVEDFKSAIGLKVGCIQRVNHQVGLNMSRYTEALWAGNFERMKEAFDNVECFWETIDAIFEVSGSALYRMGLSMREWGKWDALGNPLPSGVEQ